MFPFLVISTWDFTSFIKSREKISQIVDIQQIFYRDGIRIEAYLMYWSLLGIVFLLAFEVSYHMWDPRVVGLNPSHSSNL